MFNQHFINLLNISMIRREDMNYLTKILHANLFYEMFEGRIASATVKEYQTA